MAAMKINSKQLKEMLENKKTVLVDFWAPWCPHCLKINPAYEQIAQQYAGVLDVVKVDMDEDESLWDELNVELIPTLRLYVEGEAVSSIVAPESKAAIDEFLSGILPEKKKESVSTVHDMIIVGGGPGGYTAALYAARAGLDTLVIERLSAGGQMALTHQIDNYPGFVDGVGGYELAEQMQQQAERFGAKTQNAEVQSMDLKANPKAIVTSEGTFYGKTIVLATGANPRELGIPKEKELVGRGIAYCAACDGMFYKGKTVVVVGGGNTAAADALLLSRIAKKVIIVHRRDTLRATKIYHDPLMRAENVEFRWNSVVTELLHADKITGVRIKNVLNGEEKEIAADGVFVSVGRKPATELLAGQVELDDSGYIVAGETTQTSIHGVYAVGDVRTKLLRQVVTAVADGAVAVHMAEEFLAETL
ncbi:MAG: thioredoxin-disulfide reductase [Clostridiales bacterium]|nr:thioredoxin-disulfide reductase [Clostridiales bacterium]